MRTRPCRCGSGLSFAKCHGDSRNAYARRAAVDEARGIGAMFPWIRLRDVDAALVGIEPDVAPDALDRIVDAIEGDERRRLVDSFVHVYADRWESLITAAGDVDAAERALVAGVIDSSLRERAATDLEVFTDMERVWKGAPPYALLSLAIPPIFIWSLPEANSARAAAEGRSAGERMRAVQDVGFALGTYQHLERVRVLAGRIAEELPFPGMPRVSRAMDRACSGAARSLDARREAAWPC